LLEVNRDDQEPLDSLLKRFRRQVARNKILIEARGRAFFVSKSIQKRLKKRKSARKRKRQRR